MIFWSNIHIIAAHEIFNTNRKHDNVPSPVISSAYSDNKLLKRQKRIVVFRPLFVYKQQQKEKQKQREKWKDQQQFNQQQYPSNYEHQYYQQYLQNYYQQYYQNFNQQQLEPKYPYYQAQYPNDGDAQSNDWNYNNGNSHEYDPYNNYYLQQQHTSTYYYPTHL